MGGGIISSWSEQYTPLKIWETEKGEKGRTEGEKGKKGSFKCTCADVVAPGAGVEVLLRVQVRVALGQVDPVWDSLVDSPPVQQSINQSPPIIQLFKHSK